MLANYPHVPSAQDCSESDHEPLTTDSFEITVTLGSGFTPQQINRLKELVHAPSEDLDQLTVNLEQCHSLSLEAMRYLSELHHECIDQQVRFRIINCSGALLKTLLQESLEFLEITQF